MLNNQKQTSLIGALLCLTLLFIAAQTAFFFIHYKVADIVDSLANTSIIHAFFHPVILLPILGFVFIQFVAYGLFVGWIWFLIVSLGELFKLSSRTVYWFGIFFWLLGCAVIFLLNATYFPNSFFSAPFHQYKWLSNIGLTILLVTTLLAYVNCVWFKRHLMMGVTFIVFISLILLPGESHFREILSEKNTSFLQNAQPNIILIGLDSLRPDYIGYFGNQTIHTPTIDHFLQTAAIFTNAYTPLGRTFPSWVSILTGKYPLHHHARMNLADPARILVNDTLAKRLKANGYLTIYGTDETRFTDITKAYGFDRIIGPKGGAVEFLLGGLSDFPLTNLLINLPVGKLLFPYNYGNRAVDITYEPDKFLQLVKSGLANRPNKPVFLAIHLCLSHWPFRWAQDGQSDNVTMLNRYRSSVEAIDAQLGELLHLLKQAGLLDHSVVVLLSDHGVTLGMRGDRFITEKNYRGDPKKMKSVIASKLGSAPDFTLDIKHHYTISTSYGQGTDVLSLKQNHVLMAFNGFGVTLPAKHMSEFNSVLTIAPTILDYLHYSPMRHIDGVSAMSSIFNKKAIKLAPRPFFIETGDKVAEIESNKIYVEKVVKRTIGAYRVDINNGLLMLAPEAEQSIINNKQHAILWGDWLLALYPAEMRYKMTLDSRHPKKQITLKPTKTAPYYVLVNLKTGEWSVGLSSVFAKSAPVHDLMQQFKAFYGNEV